MVEALLRQLRGPQLRRNFTSLSGSDGLRLDWVSRPSVQAKLLTSAYVLFPGTDVLHHRFPNAVKGLLPDLQAQSLIVGIGQLLRTWT